MSILKVIFALGYLKKFANIRDSINAELDERQSTLEQQGFKVKRSEQPVNYEAALSLIAEKDNVVLRATRFLRGDKDLSVTLKRCGRETTLPLYPYKLDDAIAIANAARDLRQEVIRK